LWERGGGKKKKKKRKKKEKRVAGRSRDKKGGHLSLFPCPMRTRKILLRLRSGKEKGKKKKKKGERGEENESQIRPLAEAGFFKRKRGLSI